MVVCLFVRSENNVGSRYSSQSSFLSLQSFAKALSISKKRKDVVIIKFCSKLLRPEKKSPKKGQQKEFAKNKDKPETTLYRLISLLKTVAHPQKFITFLWFCWWPHPAHWFEGGMRL